MRRFAACGISLTVPTGWEARITRPESNLATGVDGGTEHPYLHAANFALPSHRAPFGGGVVEVMGGVDMLVAMVEFAPPSADTALFRATGVPSKLRQSEFSTSTLQRALQGQAGVQRFFHVSGRAFCLYVVIGGAGALRQGLKDANALLASVRVHEHTVAP